MRAPRTLRFARRLAAAALLTIPLPLQAQAPDARFDPVRDTIRALMAAQNIPSVSVAIARGDRILWEESFGWADKERQVRASPRTMYSLASISKPITATGLMVLAERGLVRLDEPANRYLDGAKLRAFEGAAEEATIRRLLTHTAGLPLHYQFFYSGRTPVHSMDTAIARYGVVVYPPGERYFYSNLGYGILDHIIARVSGSSYADFMRREVFEPLGLAEMVVSDGSDLGERAAVRYETDGSPLPPYTFDHLGASSVYASAHDLVRFGQWHLGARIRGARDVLPAATRARMQRSDAPAEAPGSSRGWGWGIVEDDNGLRRVAHGGGMPGVATVLMLYPAESLAVVVLANTSGAPTARIAAAMTSAVAPEYARVRQARADSIRQARAASGATAAGGPAAPVLPEAMNALETVAGVWRGALLVRGDSVPLVLTLASDGRGTARLADGPAAELNNLRLTDGWVTAGFRAEVPGPEAAGPNGSGPHNIVVHLRIRGDGLRGWASVIARSALSYGAVSYRAELAR
ncbi:MAG TPA: serine hydrolase domain-containing protein [Gemmatimonadaceae bacterium]|nr:serine hydrolase domain-containing protein [Gemmatimonadaceae bacterium]